MARVSPLDLLYARRQILAGDVLAGRRFAKLERRRLRPAYLQQYETALAALEKEGTDARDVVLAMVLEGQMPRTQHELSAALHGLDGLNRHFRRVGPPMVERLMPGCRPMAAPKSIAA